MIYDKIILGAGLYGLYSALYLARRNESSIPKKKILVLETDTAPFGRATYINQARVHMGYHYPRSISTAQKSEKYFKRFLEDYSFCILQDFEQIYATSAAFSWTNASQFVRFCRNTGIRCDAVEPERYFKEGLCDGAFVTEEYTYDAGLLRDHFLGEIEKYPEVHLHYATRLTSIKRLGNSFALIDAEQNTYETDFLLNATYASTNQIISMLDLEPFKIKYELCEIILCDVNEKLRNVGITVMDGPFFSIMPFGKTGFHSLTSVTFTPHITCFEKLPAFPCQKVDRKNKCSPEHLENCNRCEAKPASAWPYMSALARKYMREEYDFHYHSSLFSMKPILQDSEIDDSRPTVIREYLEQPVFISVLSGKINTVYDLEGVLDKYDK